MSDRVGQQLGQYRIIQHLGRGGFADVYLGEHLYLNTKAAIKVLLTRLQESELPGFLQEARTIARLTHPHIIRVLDFGVQDDTPYLVMDYAPNGTLRQRYPKGTRVPLAEIVPYVRQVAEGLQYAHDSRIIHRDVKPENMLLGNHFEILLSDFGIATIAQTSRQHETSVVGTAAYMAPEQIQGRSQAASDQYSLGVIVYEWLTGDQPFRGTFTEVATQHIFAPPPPLHTRIPSISREVETVVSTALAKDPHLRFMTISAFATALEQAGQLQSSNPQLPDNAPTLLVMPAPLTPPPPPPSSLVHSPTPLPPSFANSASAPQQDFVDKTMREPAQQQPQTTRRALLIGAGALAIGIGVGGLLLYEHSQPVKGVGNTPTAQPTAVTPQPTVTQANTTTPSPTGPTLGQTYVVFTHHTNQVTTVEWAADNSGRIASGGEDKSVYIWTASNGVVSRVHQEPDQVYTVAWSPDARAIASSGQANIVNVWDPNTGNGSVSYTGHTSPVYSVAWSPDGSRIASGSSDNTVQVWSASSGSQQFSYTQHTQRVWAVSWSPNGSYIASASWDGTVQVWDANSGQTLQVYTDPSGGHVLAVDWSHDSQYIASGGQSGVVQVWNALTKAPLRSFQGHTDNIESIKWSPDGKRIASSSKDTTVRIWNLADGSNLYTYAQHSALVWTLDWSPDGTRIASASADNTVRVWQAT